MPTPTIDVRYVADLARLELTAEEEAAFSTQLSDILGYVQKLESLDVEGIEPMAHASPVFDVLREDLARPGAGAEAALANAPDRTPDQFRVPRVVE